MFQLPIYVKILLFRVLYIALNANEIQAIRMVNKQKQNRNFPVHELQSDANHNVKLLRHFSKILIAIS